MDKFLTPQNKAMLASYARAFVSAAVALYMAGERDWASLAQAGVAAVIPPLMRWVNKKDTSFGRGAE